MNCDLESGSVKISCCMQSSLRGSNGAISPPQHAVTPKVSGEVWNDAILLTHYKALSEPNCASNNCD
jgi:hypothetical protein